MTGSPGHHYWIESAQIPSKSTISKPAIGVNAKTFVGTIYLKKKKKKLYAAESLIQVVFLFFLFLFWYLCFCYFYMKFSAKEGLSGLQFEGSHLLCLLPLNDVDIKPRPTKLSVLILNRELFFFSSLSTPCKCL